MHNNVSPSCQASHEKTRKSAQLAEQQKKKHLHTSTSNTHRRATQPSLRTLHERSHICSRSWPNTAASSGTAANIKPGCHYLKAVSTTAWLVTAPPPRSVIQDQQGCTLVASTRNLGAAPRVISWSTPLASPYSVLRVGHVSKVSTHRGCEFSDERRRFPSPKRVWQSHHVSVKTMHRKKNKSRLNNDIWSSLSLWWQPAANI